MIPQCAGPIWAIDDLSPCFQRRYLQEILPLTASALSLLIIVSHVLYHYVFSRKSVSYKLLPSEDAGDTRAAEENFSEESDPMLSKAAQIELPNLELDRPRGEIAFVVIEAAALIGLVTTFVLVLSTDVWGPDGRLPALARLVSWSYLLFLVLVRLLLSVRQLHSSAKLWNHTSILYGLQWLFTVFVFRSAVIYPLSKRALNFSAIEFSLSSFLVLLSVSTRRGNKAVLVPHEEGLEPARHPVASLLSLATFTWLDGLIWKGYKQPLELNDIWNLTASQKASTVLEDFRCRQYKGSLVWKLLRYFAGPLLLQGAWTVFSNLFTYLPTLLLKVILEYIEDPRSTTPNAAWLYAVLIFVSSAVQGVADGQGLWIGRRIGVKLRAIIIGEIYAKALRRKAGPSTEAVKKPSEDKPVDKKKRILSFGRKKKKATTDPENDTANKKESEEESETANIGTIINLMAIDSFKVSEVGAYLHFLWASVPVQIIIAVSLLYKLLGFSSFAGIVIMILMIPVNLFIAKKFSKLQKQILKGTDARINSTNEILQNIRIIKYFAWEDRFQDIVNDKRRAELKALRYRYMLWSGAATIWYGTPILITFASFFLYTVVEGKRLTPSIAFPALSMFSLLRIPLDQLADMVAHVQESKVSLDRVDKYLNEEETDKYKQLADEETSEPRIALDNATLTWGTGKKNENGEQDETFRLIDVNVEFLIGKLNIIAGQTGSGKTSLLMALLGEMKLLEGRVHLPGGTANRAELPVDGHTGLIESVAYCAQEAWLVNDTIKENIIFASPFDQERYDAVIKACALERDLEILDAGDDTLVGEKGIGLSGGQKQRISLARAIYSRARHLLLDDCLSAVDSHTAKHIFRLALSGPLMLHRTCILVTHNIALTAPYADFIVAIENGKISFKGSPDDPGASKALGEDLTKSRPASRSSSPPPRSRRPSESGNANGVANGTTNETANGTPGKPIKKGDRSKTKLEETKSTGSIKWAIIQMYLRSMGPWYYWIAASLVFTLQQLGSVSTNIWIRQWANSYSTETVDIDNEGTYAAMANFKFPSFNVRGVPRTSGFASQVGSQAANSDNDVNASYYLGVYALIGIFYLGISAAREGILFWGSLHASDKIHKRLLNTILHAKFKFFDSTPLGQLMNRFSKDVEAIDQEVAPVAIGMMHSLASVIMIVILISIITPGFLVAAVLITIIYFALGAVYLNGSRDMKRLESIQRSPLYQQFGETLNGIVTIRAYGDGPRFLVDNHRRINSYNRPHIYLWASNRWLAFRVDIVGALVAFVTASFVLLNVGRIDAGAAGLSLTYAITFTENVLWLVRLYSEVQQSMNSVERIKEYLDVEKEAAPIIEDARPPTDWPSRGVVEFSNYSTRYRADLDPVLREVSFTVQSGEKVGIVGRTGAGKSSLALALFRGLEAEKGQIRIDGVDIGSIGLRDLREAITIVPQDPTLFTGTIRSNLDPFGLFTDEEIFTAIRRVHLIGSGASGTATPIAAFASTDSGSATPSETNLASSTILDNKNVFQNLESPVSESGSNLSQGQRQLLCLARALLKNPKVLMMDEATASIDYSTDAKIQETLRELRDNTIITIAHRLQTIIDYDKVLVLDHGRVVEYDHPWTLVNKDEGIFRSMCENSGNLESLLEGAKKAWDQNRLVDDS
ncbi:hypothetical protein BJX70DRAFT_194915 [Aspergillus crustosus]